MTSNINNIRLFFRLALCNHVTQEELTRYLPELNTIKLIETFEDQGEGDEIRKLALRGLAERTDVTEVLQSFFKVTNRSDLSGFENEVLALLLKHLSSVKPWQLKASNIRMHSQKGVRLNLMKLLATPKYFGPEEDEIVTEAVKNERDPDVLKEAVQTVINRPSCEMNQILFQLVGNAPKEIDELVRKALPGRRYHQLENELCEVLKKEIESSNGKSTRKIKALRSVLLQRVKRLDYAHVLALLNEKIIPQTDLLEHVYKIFQKKLQNPRIDCAHLINLFHLCAEYPREKNLIFRAILDKEKPEVVEFLKEVASEGSPAENYWQSAIGELFRRGEMENFKAELICDV